MHSSPFHGVYAATLTPFTEAGDIDTRLLTAHFQQVVSVEGMTGVLCNGHAGENYLLSHEETREVVETAVATIGDRAIIAAGVIAEATREAVARAKVAEACGADAIVVFPPFSWALSNEPEMIVHHHRAIRDAVDVPIFLYMTSVAAGRLNYRPDILEALLQIENVVGIKEGSWDTNVYERTRSIVDRIAPHVAVMASGDEALFPSFVLGTEGSMVSLASIVGEEIVALYRAVGSGDHAQALGIHRRLQPLANFIYGRPPVAHAVARLKAAMFIMGRWPESHARRPIGPLPETEIHAIRRVLIDAGFVGEMANV